jgi:hypothetical protein
MSKSLALFFLVCFATACQEHVEQGINLTRFLPAEELARYDRCMVIPRSGCAGCISSTMSFVAANIDSLNETLIIFTGIEDFKLLKLRVGVNVLNKKNVLVDSTGDIPVNIIYPEMISLTEGKVVKTERFVPGATNFSR